MYKPKPSTEIHPNILHLISPSTTHSQKAQIKKEEEQKQEFIRGKIKENLNTLEYTKIKVHADQNSLRSWCTSYHIYYYSLRYACLRILDITVWASHHSFHILWHHITSYHMTSNITFGRNSTPPTRWRPSRSPTRCARRRVRGKSRSTGMPRCLINVCHRP